MLKISILKVENPSCLWGRVVRGPGGDAETTEQYDSLLAQMNLFYNEVSQDLRQLKAASLEEGQVCVVYWSVMKLWCRAVVESVIVDSVSSQARCLLVDHGERLIVPSDQIRVAVRNFLQLPFWVRRFHLAGIKPMTLRVSVYEEKAELIPSTQWDSSATLYLHTLLRVSSQTDAVLLETESDSTSIELYLTVRSIKICVNDDLVAKKFAVYIRETVDSDGLDEVDQFPVMLSSSILTQTVYMTSNKPTAPTPPRPVMSHHVAAAGAGDWLIAPLTAQLSSSALSEDQEHLSPGSQSDTSSAAAAAERFLKFLNPGGGFQQAASSIGRHEELNERRPEETTFSGSSGQEIGDSGADDSSQDESVAAEERSRWRRRAAQEKPWRSEEERACSRLLEWLNPEPLNPDTADDVVVPSDPRRNGILVHSTVPVEPCSSLDDAPIVDTLRWVLRRKHYNNLSTADQYSWPAVARGCNTIIISHNAEQPLSYLAPLLSHILMNSVFSSLTSSTGPIAVLLCPGWEKVQALYELLEEMKVAPTLHPIIVLLGIGKDEAKAVRIPKNCLLLVTTPFSLVRLLSSHCFLFLRLYHLVLDEADRLFSLAPDEMATILQHFQKVTSSEEKASCPQQLVAMAKRWTCHMNSLLANHMPYPCIVITVPEEAALYGNVQQVILMTLESSKLSILTGALDFNPDVSQKTLIVTKSAQEVEDLFKAVSNESAFCLQAHEGLTHQFDFVIQQWRKDIGPGTHIILVTTNECLKCLGIRDATCVVHYGFPYSPKVFGNRLFCMAENFRNLCERDQTDVRPRLSKSVLLISERNACHVVGVLRYLVRTNAPLPPELLTFAQGVYVAREDQKTSRPLCSYLKGFGVCRDFSMCPDRHTVIPHLDQSLLPASGVIEVIPLYVKTASVFHGRIVRKDDDGFQSMAAQMTHYYADKKPAAIDVLEGGLYAVQENDIFHRVKILVVPDRGDRLFYSVSVRFIDVGKEEEVKSHQLLQLPQQFQSLPGQAVEMIVCRVKPADAEINWHPKVTRTISQKIRGRQHRARAVFSLGNTIFIDPMVCVTQLPGMKAVINEYSVQSEILTSGMGVTNPEHLDLLRTLCQEAGHLSGSGDGPTSLEGRIKAEEEVLTEAFSRLTNPPHLNLCEPLNSKSTVPTPPEPPAADQKSSQRNSPTADLKSAEQTMRNKHEEEIWCSSGQAAAVYPEDSNKHQTTGGDEAQQVISTETDDHNVAKCFHPQVRWYQMTDCVIVTVKLMKPEKQRCDFYPDRVIYSGSVNGRTYRANLELHADIAAERCCWEMKSNEPVLRLVKQQQGHWERLLRIKNIFVSYDMEHFDLDEVRTPNGVCFVENTGEDHWYINSESGSESD